jgi:adhesin/invasin
VTPGSYQGTVTIAANAANAPITIPVLFDVFAPGAPLAYFQGAVNNSAIERGDVLAKGTIVALFGEQFTLGAPQQGAFPLTTDLAGTKVFVNDQPAPIFYSSYSQINFQIPYDVVAGDAVIRVDRSGQLGNNISVTIAESAPRILKLGIGNYGIVVNQDGSLPIPQTPGIPSHPAKAGDALVIYAVGLGQTTPSATAGTAAPTSPLAVAPAVTNVLFGGGLFLGDPISVTPFFVGLTPGFAGLYQINVVVPAGLLPGDVALVLTGPNGIVSKTSAIAVQ